MSSVAIVTGSNKGIGFSIVRALCKQYNGEVYLTSRDVGKGLAAVKELESEGLQPKYHQLDISDGSSINTLRDYMDKHYGGVGVLVNNAGIVFKNEPSVAFKKQAKQTFLTNFTGTLNLTKSLMPMMDNNGRVVTISGMLSLAAYNKCSPERKRQLSSPSLTMNNLEEIMDEFLSYDDDENAINAGFSEQSYDMSKLGLNVATRIFGKELNRIAKHRLLANCCCPGWTKTDMGGMKAKKLPDEGAKAPICLALLPPGVVRPQGEFFLDGQANEWYHKY